MLVKVLMQFVALSLCHILYSCPDGGPYKNSLTQNHQDYNLNLYESKIRIRQTIQTIAFSVTDKVYFLWLYKIEAEVQRCVDKYREKFKKRCVKNK